MDKLTKPQAGVLQRIAADGNLEEAFDWFRGSHRDMPFMVDDRAFTKVLDALQRKNLIDAEYKLTEAGKVARDQVQS